MINLNTMIDIFSTKYEMELSKPKIRIFEMDGGVTIAEDDGDLFDLSGPAILEEKTVEVVKRISIDSSLLSKLVHRGYLAKSLFKQIDEEMNELGCPDYSFEFPEGGVFLKMLEDTNGVELRAYGLAKEKKQ